MAKIIKEKYDHPLIFRSNLVDLEVPSPSFSNRFNNVPLQPRRMIQLYILIRGIVAFRLTYWCSDRKAGYQITELIASDWIRN